MDAAEAIIEKILGDAQNAADALVSRAKAAAAEKLKLAKKEVAAREDAELSNVQNNLLDLRERASRTAAIEQKKADLTAKRAILDAVFADARAEIKQSKNYKTLIENLIIKYCTCDACIVVSRRDEKILTAEFIKSLATKCKSKFTRRVSDDFDGGIVIECEKFDLSLTIDNLLANAREQTEKPAAKILWG